MEGAKMSKSKGNVVRPQDYIDKFGLDALRYFVFREMAFGQDASFTDEAFLTRYNSDLANDLGNLVSRATTMIHRYCAGAIPAAGSGASFGPDEISLNRTLDSAINGVQSSARTFRFELALREIWDAIGATNRYIVAREPWRLAKDATKRAELDTSLNLVGDAVRIIAELLRPFIPGTAERTLAMLGLPANQQSWKDLKRGDLRAGTALGQTAALFPRIEHTVEELRTMSSDQAPGTAPGTQAPGTAPGTLAPGTAAPISRITIDDFMKVELRVAKVLAAERVPKSKKLLKLSVDVGTEQRTIVAGIAEAYEPETLVGRTIVIVFNLQPATLMGVESNGMVLAASPEGGKPVLLSFEEPPPPGARVR
jgi:methionyl-tRNA synthetase